MSDEDKVLEYLKLKGHDGPFAKMRAAQIVKEVETIRILGGVDQKSLRLPKQQ